MLMNKGELTEEEEKEWFFKIDLLRLERKMIKRNLPQGLKLLQIVNQHKISCYGDESRRIKRVGVVG